MDHDVPPPSAAIAGRTNAIRPPGAVAPPGATPPTATPTPQAMGARPAPDRRRTGSCRRSASPPPVTPRSTSASAAARCTVRQRATAERRRTTAEPTPPADSPAADPRAAAAHQGVDARIPTIGSQPFGAKPIRRHRHRRTSSGPDSADDAPQLFWLVAVLTLTGLVAAGAWTLGSQSGNGLFCRDPYAVFSPAASPRPGTPAPATAGCSAVDRMPSRSDRPNRSPRCLAPHRDTR